MEIQSGKYTVYFVIDDEEKNIRVSDIEQLYFIEDIFSYSIVGKLQFHDRQGLLEFGPITGNEKIGIIYGVSEDTERVFDIYKVNRIIPSWSDAQGKENFIEVIFVDEMFYDLTNREYSRSWSNQRYSDVVKSISSNMLGVSSFEEFEESREYIDKFYMPYWTPKSAIDWLSKRCSGGTSNQSGYLFYNNSLGTNFITLEKLLNQRKLMNIGWKNSGHYSFKTESEQDYNKILGYEVSGIDNISRMEVKGGHRRGYDFSRKKFLENSYTYKEGIDKYTLLGEKSLFEDISDENVRNRTYGDTDLDIINNIYYDNWIKTYCMQQTLSILVSGYEERYAGGLIEVEWPSAHDKEVYNKNFAGRYLIKSITHQFGANLPMYKQKMILVKNAYEGSDNINLVKAKNKNLSRIEYD